LAFKREKKKTNALQGKETNATRLLLLLFLSFVVTTALLLFCLFLRLFSTT